MPESKKENKSALVISEKVILHPKDSESEYTLVRFEGNGEHPYIQDLELAKKLGYTRPRNIRQLIKEHIDAGNLKDFKVCCVAQQTSQGGRPSDEYWLSEQDALFLIAKSGTQIANQILQEVIAVYLAWRHGRLNQIPTALLETVTGINQLVTYQGKLVEQQGTILQAHIEATNKRFDDLESRIKGQPAATAQAVSTRETEKITEEDCRSVRDYIQTNILQTVPSHRVRSLRAKIYARLARTVGKDSYRNCPRYRVGDVWNEVREIEDFIHFALTSGTEQLDLFPKKQRPRKVGPAKVIELKAQAAKNKAKKEKGQAS